MSRKLGKENRKSVQTREKIKTVCLTKEHFEISITITLFYN